MILIIKTISLIPFAFVTQQIKFIEIRLYYLTVIIIDVVFYN